MLVNQHHVRPQFWKGTRPPDRDAERATGRDSLARDLPGHVELGELGGVAAGVIVAGDRLDSVVDDLSLAVDHPDRPAARLHAGDVAVEAGEILVACNDTIGEGVGLRRRCLDRRGQHGPRDPDDVPIGALPANRDRLRAVGAQVEVQVEQLTEAPNALHPLAGRVALHPALGHVVDNDVVPPDVEALHPQGKTRGLLGAIIEPHDRLTRAGDHQGSPQHLGAGESDDPQLLHRELDGGGRREHPGRGDRAAGGGTRQREGEHRCNGDAARRDGAGARRRLGDLCDERGAQRGGVRGDAGGGGVRHHEQLRPIE